MSDSRDVYPHEPPVRQRRRDRGNGRALFLATPTWAAAGAALSAPEVLVLSGPARSAPSLAVTCTLLQLPVLATTVLLGARRTARRLLSFGEATLRRRTEQAEAELALEHERLHELRSTVVGITASYRLLHGSDTRLTDRHRARLERMHEDELGRLERLLHGASDVSAEAVELDAVIDPLVESVRARGHRVRWRHTDLRAWGRADDIAEIVHVLLENALQHTGGRGLRVDAARTGSGVEVRVTDRGPGIAPEVLPRLFERGARGDDSPGQGIGLHVAHRLSVEMGGQLRPEPRQDGTPGTTFVLALPTDREVATCLAASS